ncbi:MAG: YIP1 family protein, partial [Bacillota bacterium]
MKKQLFKIFIILLLLFVFFSFKTRADNVPYKSYTYDYWQNIVPAPPAYIPDGVYYPKDLGVDNIETPRDMHIHEDQIFIVDGGADRIIILNDDWETEKILEEFETDHQTGRFNNPRGIYVDTQDNTYVADTNNKRVVVFDEDFRYQRKITLDEEEVSALTPDYFEFKPSKVAVDPLGRIYAIVSGTYEGILAFNSAGEFLGFIGNPEVNPDPVDYFWRRIATEQQRERMTRLIPVEYNNLEINEKGFVFATIGTGEISEETPVRKLNPSGTDVLRRLGPFAPVGDLKYPEPLEVDEDQEFGTGEIEARYTGPSKIVDSMARENGIYSILDQNRGRVFTYDYDGRLLYIFGGPGNSEGLLNKPIALDNLGDKIVILGETNKSITVYKPTQYANSIHTAIDQFLGGFYEQSLQEWREVLKYNSNSELAYVGIGKSLYSLERYGEAMDFFVLGNAREEYSEIFEMYRYEFFNENFSLMILGLLLFLLVIFVLVKWRYKKKNENDSETNNSYSGVTNKDNLNNILLDILIKIKSGLGYTFYLIFHPFVGFWKLKEDEKGNIPTAVTILFLGWISYVVLIQYTAFDFNTREISQVNIFMEMVSIFLPLALWCVVNWALTIFMDGKGTGSDIFIASSYALTPLIFLNIATVSSYIFSLQESHLYYLLISVIFLWILGLLFAGNLITNEYSVNKTVFNTILIIIGMGSILFVGLLFFSIIDLMLQFLNDIY